MVQKNEKKKENEKLIILIILILITLIIIIFLLIKYFGRIDHKPQIPTGNVDIFDIVFGNGTNVNDCRCYCHCQGNISSVTACDSCKYNNIHFIGNNNSGNNSSNNNDDTKTGFMVYDDDTIYSKETQLNIFTQTSYNILDNKIAPGSENSYQFVIRNNNDFNVIYNLDMIEINDYNINMKYRLKLNGNYVVGNDNEYVSVDELNQYNIALANYTYDVYTLDWKWLEGSNDTEVGTNIKANYQLNLKITVTEY